ncbi:MAG: calcium/sodium antiporter [Candidatus Nanoarchaeia archaeon]
MAFKYPCCIFQAFICFKEISMITGIVFILIGFILLYFGAEWLVNGAANLAKMAGVSQLVVGLTVVAFGTSAPELVVSLHSGLQEHGNIAIGNVVGSNICNIALILGLSSLIYPVKINLQILRFDAPLMMLVTIVFSFMLFQHKLSQIEGFILFAGIIAYTAYSIFKAKRGNSSCNFDEEIPGDINSIPICIFFVFAGIISLVLGSKALVHGAVVIARLFHVSEAVIGLTIVAVGTSLPELATSVFAAIKKHSDISVGNVIGSNIFNILCIVGATASITPINFPDIGTIDIAFMLGLSILLYPFMLSGKILNRIEGAILLFSYIGYIIILLLKE